MLPHRPTFTSVFVIGILLWATLNALSWFAWSWTFVGLFIRDPDPPVGIGFPLLVWTSDAMAASFLPNVEALTWNLAIGLAASAATAAIATRFLHRRAPSPAAVAKESMSVPPGKPAQYSLRSLLLAITIASVLLGILKYETDPVRGALALICLAGPGMIALAGYATSRFGDTFSNRVTLALAAFLMIAAGVLGEVLWDLQDFTRALMALFVCWTPQFVLIALSLRVLQYLWSRRQNAADFSE